MPEALHRLEEPLAPCRGRACRISWSPPSTRVTVRAPPHERLGHLQADVAAADDHDRRGTRDVRARSSSALASSSVCTPRTWSTSMPGQVGAGGAGAGGDVELVEAEVEGALVLVVAHLHRPPVRVDADHLVVEAHVDAVLLAELLRACGPPGRRATPPRRRPGTGSRRPSSWSTRPSRGPRSRGRAAGVGPAWRPPCPPASPPITTSRSAIGWQATGAPRARLPRMAVREDCRHYSTRTTPSGEVVQRCRVEHGRDRTRSPARPTACSSSPGRSPTPAGSGSTARRTNPA